MTPNAVPAAPPGAVPNLSAELQRQLQNARSRVFTYSDYVKQVDCTRCGAPKRLPSKTAYLYCDHCGSLIDYDFRAANLGTHAALTNLIFGYLIRPVRGELDKAVVLGDKDRYRQLLWPVYAEWVRQLPMAVSPRANTDEEFRQATVRFLVECMLCNDFSPQAVGTDDALRAASNRLQRIQRPDGTLQVDDHIWEVAALFKKRTELSYAAVEQAGVLALDPDQTPLDILLRMEYSLFCQNWLPNIASADAERFLEFFGLKGEYAKANVTDAQTRKCGNCGDELRTMPGAQAVICESCGRKLDIAGGEVPCQQCGAPLSFPVGLSAIECPYCHAGTHRV